MEVFEDSSKITLLQTAYVDKRISMDLILESWTKPELIRFLIDVETKKSCFDEPARLATETFP